MNEPTEPSSRGEPSPVAAPEPSPVAAPEPSPVAAPEPAPYLALYRRYRPGSFAEVAGQDHVSMALRNAVREGRVGHAYLFSGPRGTGKTSTARILAKALNCLDPAGGEPCGECSSCLAVADGRSLDVHELDAASNNGVDAMRDLVSRAALGTPGRWKVYIVDEVHMLSTAASNALLKTLEEPPAHVVFVLATTDPQKVLPTIRSRTQHFEFRLLPAALLRDLLVRVRADAGVDVADGDLEAAIRRARGSARDALSALDQVAAGGILEDDLAQIAAIVDALSERDVQAALGGLAKSLDAGKDPQRVAVELVDELRQCFLVTLAPELASLDGEDRERALELARRAGLASLVRAIEGIGRALVEMRDAPDPRVNLEVALVRIVHPEADNSLGAVLERLERLERALATGNYGSGGSHASPGVAPVYPAPTRLSDPDAVELPSPARAPAGSEAATKVPARGGAEVEESAGSEASGEVGSPTGPALARRTLGVSRREVTRTASTAPQSASGTPSPAPVRAAPQSASGMPSPAPARTASPSREEVVQAWGDGLLASLPGRAKARVAVGRFVSSGSGIVTMALPNEAHKAACEEVKAEVEALLCEHFGQPLRLELVVDTGDAYPGDQADTGYTGDQADTGDPGNADPADAEAKLLDPVVLEEETEVAGKGPGVTERLKLAFPGAEEV